MGGGQNSQNYLKTKYDYGHHDPHHNHHEMIHNGQIRHVPNGAHNGNAIEIDSNDTNNNSYNQKHKRSSSSSGDASSSKRTKFNSQSSQSVPSEKVNKYASNVEGGSNGIGSHYNIMEKLKELYRELKGDKMCKEVSENNFKFKEISNHFIHFPASLIIIVISTR